MKRHLAIAASLVLALAAACSPKTGYRTDGQSVTLWPSVQADSLPRAVRITLVDDDILRVEASPTTSIPDNNSLAVLPQTVKPDISVEERGDSLYIKGKGIAAAASLKTGELAFYDAQGKLLTQELQGLGKRFATFTSQQAVPKQLRTGVTWRLRLDSPDDEAFYGLGQHQSEEMNYKGRDEKLFQYNTKVSVPFVVSTRGYGLLWDSYSLCRWGNPQEYRQLADVFELTDAQGQSGALTGTYTDREGEELVRREDSLYFENSAVIGNLPGDFKLNGSHVVYEGAITAPASQTFRFSLYYAGYVKVFVGDSLVVPERWRTAWNPNTYKFACALQANQPTPLRIEWAPDGDVSYLGLRVAHPQSEAEQQQVSVWSEMARKMDYYIMAGPTMDDVIANYRQLTGRAPVMPRWSMGFWQSRERYKTQDEVVGTLAEFRRRHIPIDNIVQDWNYWPIDQWGSHHFEEERFPSPQAMLDSVHAMHGRFMISVWPKFYVDTEHYRQFDAKGWMYRQAVDDDIHDWLGYVGSFYDAYSEPARQLFWKQINDSLYARYNYGIDAWWMDASEPNVRDCTPLEYHKTLCGPTALGSSDEYLNAYALVNAHAIYNGQRSVQPNKRVFLLTRSGFAGLQRYSTATWSGDIGTRWEDMRAQMSAGLNYSISGIPFWGMDQGGFCVEHRYEAAQQTFDHTGVENADLKEWRELQTRWTQMGCFIPIYRSHGQWPLREVWNIAPEGHPAYEAIVESHRMRYRLMPYIYSMAGWVNNRDYTMLRPLVMDYPEDMRVRDIYDQWMFGPSLMACPVTEYGARQRSVYLPQSGWYDLYTGRYYTGGEAVVADAPYSHIPVFVRAGSIIPVGPEQEWSDQCAPELITLYVYTGADAEFTLYEDDGVSYDYETGAQSTIRFSWNEGRQQLTIHDREGSFPGMLANRRFQIVVVNPDSATPLQPSPVNGKPIVEYSGKEKTIFGETEVKS